MLYDPQNFLHSMCLWAAQRSTGGSGVNTEFTVPCAISYATA